MKSARSGVTFFELLIILGVMAVLGGVLLYGSGIVQRKWRDTVRVKMMQGVMAGLEDYRIDNDHYPVAGDPIPGGTFISSSTSFNSVLTALIQGGYFSATALTDPLYGKLFDGFSGGDKSDNGLKFTEQDAICNDRGVMAQTDVGQKVFYAYGSPDGKSFVMCLTGESGETLKFYSPKD